MTHFRIRYLTNRISFYQMLVPRRVEFRLRSTIGERNKVKRIRLLSSQQRHLIEIHFIKQANFI